MIKCTLTEVKANKIRTLETQNNSLSAQLQQLLSQSQNFTQSFKSSNLNITSLQAQIQVEQMRKSLLNTSVQNLKRQYIEAQKVQSQMDKKLIQISEQAKNNEQTRWQLSKQKQEQDNLAQRLKNELKIYMSMSKNGSNIIILSDNLKKAHQCLLRTLAILKNKLESHKKYLSILQKKEDKNNKDQQNKTNNIANKTKSSTKLYNPLKNEKLKGNFEQKKEYNTIQIDRIKIKQFDELTRKKNQLLMSKGKKL